jgi:MFS family permease
MASSLGWTTAQVTLGYSVMMVFYAVAAYFSGLILAKWGSKPVYTIAAIWLVSDLGGQRASHG